MVAFIVFLRAAMSASHDREHVTCVDKSIPMNPSAAAPATDRKNLLKEMPHVVRETLSLLRRIVEHVSLGRRSVGIPRIENLGWHNVRCPFNGTITQSFERAEQATGSSCSDILKPRSDRGRFQDLCLVTCSRDEWPLALLGPSRGWPGPSRSLARGR